MKYKQVAVLSQDELETNCLPTLFQWLFIKKLNVDQQRALRADRDGVVSLNKLGRSLNRYMSTNLDQFLGAKQSYLHTYMITDAVMPHHQGFTFLSGSDIAAMYSHVKTSLTVLKEACSQVVFDVTVKLNEDNHPTTTHVLGIKRITEGVLFLQEKTLFERDELKSNSFEDAWEQHVKTAIATFVGNDSLYALRVVGYSSISSAFSSEIANSNILLGS